MSVIRVMVTDDDKQLAEIHLEKIRQYETGASEYQAKVAVDSGPVLHCFTRTFVHRDRHNVLGMLESLIFELGVDETNLQGPYEKKPTHLWKELGSTFDA